MTNTETIRRAIFNIGGTNAAARKLRVSVSAIGKWARNGCIPNLERALYVAEHSGFDINVLRPRFDPKVIV